jgi:putative oxidoreductase
MYQSDTRGAARPRSFVPFMTGFYERAESWAYPLMRFVVGAFLVPHGMQKLFGAFGGNAEQTAGFFSKLGIEPALPLTYLVGGVEFFGGILIAIGLFTRVAAAAVVIMMIVAVTKVHLAKGFFWTTGGFEYPAMWGLLALAIFFRGGGGLSADRAIGKEF